MIVVVVIGILAAVTIPFYQGNAIKSQVNRAVGELSTYRVAFETLISASAPINNSSLGYAPSNLSNGDALSQIAVVNSDGSGRTQVTMGGNAHPNLRGVILRFVRGTGGNWQCVIDPAASPGWREKYRPETCTVI